MKKHIYISILTLTAISAPVISSAINTVIEGFHISNTQTMIDAHSICRNSVVTDGKDYFVPTKTNSEWQAFIDNTPSGVSLTACYTGTWIAYGGCSEALSSPNPYQYNNGMTNIYTGSLVGQSSCSVPAVIGYGYPNLINFSTLPYYSPDPIQDPEGFFTPPKNCAVGEKGYWIHPVPRQTRTDLINSIMVYNCV